MLEELAKKDAYWRKIAKKISKDDFIADDLVNEMYIKLHDCKKQINDFYVIIVMRNLFLNQIKQNKTVSIEEFYNLEYYESDFEVDDNDQEVLKAYNALSFSERELILLSSEHSLRDIEKDYNINYGFVYRKVKAAKEKIKLWQKEKLK
jgi:RNA polymerase sigma factor (sigma-70 family)